MMSARLRNGLLPILLLGLGSCSVLDILAPSGAPLPIPQRPLVVQTDCQFQNEGGSGRLRVDVAGGQVRAFAAQASFPQHGSCQFELQGFHQTKQSPIVELLQNDGSCIVRMWEQGTRVTVAFEQCAAQCTGDAWDQLLPLIYDRRDGSCA